MTEPTLRRRRLLPPEIVEEILCNLPVKSLNRFRSVSSDWQSLISDNRFIRKHLTSSQRTRFIIANNIDTYFTEHLYRFPLPSSSDTTENEYAYDLLPISSMLNMSQQQWRLPLLVASCDGLLWVHVCSQIYILNPSMKTFRQIDDCSSYGCFSAFGYDSIGDDYKLIKISRESGVAQTWVYSLKNSSWRRADDFPFPDYFTSTWYAGDFHLPCYTFLNGRIYWLAFCYSSKKFAFFNFDLSENKYINMPFNLSFWECFPGAVNLSVLRGMLCVCFHNQDNDCLDLWAMKDCTDENSWTKLLRVPFQLVLCKYGDTLPNFEGLDIYENGEVLVGVVCSHGNDVTEILLCKDSRILSRKTISSCCILWGFAHVESLISP